MLKQMEACTASGFVLLFVFMFFELEGNADMGRWHVRLGQELEISIC